MNAVKLIPPGVKLNQEVDDREDVIKIIFNRYAKH